MLVEQCLFLYHRAADSNAREKPVLKIEQLISYRFAVVVISILLAASAAGWILTELIPPDFPERIQLYRERWGDAAVRIIQTADLYDPFHSVWYRAVLALFLVVLTACLVTRWNRFLLRSLRIDIPDRVETIGKRKLRAEVALAGVTGGRDEDGSGRRVSPPPAPSIEELRRFFRRRGYTVRAERREGAYLFAAVAGRWRYLGNFLFHFGILVITVGAVIGSFWGGSGFVYGSAGDLLPLPGSGDSVLVRDFRILKSDRGEIRDYISTVSVVNAEGDTVLTGEIEVNHPLRYEGVNIYQSSYFAAEDEFMSATVSLTEGGREITLNRGRSVTVAELGLSVEPGRFFPDFRMGRNGPYSASLSLQNPALEIEVKGMGRAERGWLFLNHPRFNSKFDLPVSPSLVRIEPIYYTGLQVSYNPGEHVLMAGILFGTVGLILLYLFNHRIIGCVLDRKRLLVAGLEYRWRVGFGEEFDSMSTELRERYGRNSG
jgi:cytochrome c biogenesis protein